MRLILALCLALVCGEAFGSIAIQHLRIVSAIAQIGPSNDPADITSDGSYPATPLAASSFKSNATASASASSSLTADLGAGVLNDNLLSLSGHTFADTTGSFAGTLLASSYARFASSFKLDEATTFHISLSNGAFTVTDDFSVKQFVANGATTDSFTLQPGRYGFDFLWKSDHKNGSVPAGENIQFLAALGFDGESYILTPEASSVVAWSVLALMGLGLPLTGRLRNRLPRLRR